MNDEFEEEKVNKEGEVIRVRLPKSNEVIGIVTKLLGAARMDVKCVDGRTRRCRVPGRFRRSLWIKEGNVVIVKPWDIEGDIKGDIVYKYSKTQEQWLRDNNYLSVLEEEF